MSISCADWPPQHAGLLLMRPENPRPTLEQLR